MKEEFSDIEMVEIFAFQGDIVLKPDKNKKGLTVEAQGFKPVVGRLFLKQVDRRLLISLKPDSGGFTRTREISTLNVQVHYGPGVRVALDDLSGEVTIETEVGEIYIHPDKFPPLPY